MSDKPSKKAVTTADNKIKDKERKRPAVSSQADTKRAKGEEKGKAQLTEHEIFNLDVEASKKYDSNTCLSNFIQTSAGVKEAITAIRDLKKSKDKTAVAEIVEQKIYACLGVAKLRKLNRYSQLGLAAAKDATAERKNKSDQYHLKLQNLLYEVAHLQKEIDKCLEFRSKDEELKLVPVDEFYRDAPEAIARRSETEADPHEQRKARLQWEMEQRKTLADELKDAKAKIDTVQADIQSRESNLDSLGPKLNKILEATRPVQDYLGMPFEEERQQLDTAKHLTQPLFILYRNLSALKSRSKKGNLKVTITGDVDKAKQSNEQLNEQDVDSDSDQEEETHQKSKHRKRLMSAHAEDSPQSKLLTQFPLSIHVELSDLGSCKVRVVLTFIYLPSLEVVTVKATVEETLTATSITASGLLDADSILSAIYPSDQGMTNPNPATQSKVEQLSPPSLAHFSSQVGKAYRWAQNVSGLKYLLDTCDDESEVATVSAVIKRLKTLVQTRLDLVSHLIDLEKGVLNLPQLLTQALPSSAPVTSLQQWCKSTYEDYSQLCQTQRLISCAVVNSSWQIYSAKFVCTNMKISAQVAVSPNFPEVTPVMSLAIEDPHLGSLNNTNSDVVLEMEAEVNERLDGLVQRKSDILSAQLIKLCWCCDVLSAVSDHESGIGDSKVSVRFLPQPHSGKNRRFPFKYNAKTGFFEH